MASSSRFPDELTGAAAEVARVIQRVTRRTTTAGIANAAQTTIDGLRRPTTATGLATTLARTGVLTTPLNTTVGVTDKIVPLLLGQATATTGIASHFSTAVAGYRSPTGVAGSLADTITGYARDQHAGAASGVSTTLTTDVLGLEPLTGIAAKQFPVDIVWETSTDWDNAVAEEHVTHGSDTVSLLGQVGEIGNTSLSDTIDSGVVNSISFQKSYTNPVVFHYCPTRGGGNATVTRIKNLSSSGMDIFLEEWSNGGHSTETVCYMVLEAGTYTLGNAKIEVGTISTSNVHRSGDSLNGVNVSFSNSFAAEPTVLTDLQTYNNTAAMDTACYKIGTGGFTTEQEAGGSGNSVSTETIGWAAFSRGDYDWGGNLADIDETPTDGSNDGPDNTSQQISFSQAFGSTPEIIVNPGSLNGGEGWYPRGAGSQWNTSGHDVYAEEPSGDSEQGHADENFQWLAMASGAIIDETGYLTTATKTFDVSGTPDLTKLQYSLNDGSITIDAIGSPGTASEEIVSQSLGGASSYSLSWSNSHTNFRLRLNMSYNGGIKPTLTKAALGF